MIRETIRATLGNHYQKKCRIALQEKRWEDALFNAEKALKFLPVDTGVLNNRGIALWKLGKYKQAIDCFDMVIGRYRCFEDESLYFVGDNKECLKEDYISALNNKGAVLYCLGKHKEARKLHESVLKLDPHRKSATHNLLLDLTPVNKG